jgi:hypothetical protein
VCRVEPRAGVRTGRAPGRTNAPSPGPAVRRVEPQPARATTSVEPRPCRSPASTPRRSARRPADGFDRRSAGSGDGAPARRGAPRASPAGESARLGAPRRAGGATAGHRLQCALDGDALVVAHLLAARIVVVRLAGQLVGVLGQALPRAVAAPQLVGRRELVETQKTLDGGRVARAVVEQEAVAVGREDERHVERGSVGQGLLHAAADGMGVVLGLDDREGEIGLVEEQVVGPLLLAAGGQLAANDDAAGRERVLAADLGMPVPPRRGEGGRDVVLADLRLVEGPLVGHRPSTELDAPPPWRALADRWTSMRAPSISRRSRCGRRVAQHRGRSRLPAARRTCLDCRDCRPERASRRSGR